MSAEQQLVVIEPKNVMAVFTTPGAVDPILERIRQEIDDFTPDVTTKKGRDAVASMAYRVAQSKTYLDSVGKKLADEVKDIPKKVDASRKKVRDTLDQWRDEVRAPLTIWEAAEKARIDRHRHLIATMTEWAARGPDGGSEKINPCIELVMGIEISPSACEEFEAEYARAKDAALRTLRDALDVRLKGEAEQRELAELRRQQAEREAEAARRAEIERAAAAEREQLEREARIAAEAADRAEKAAAAKIAQAAADAERARQEADRRAQREREAAEREARLQREAAERVAREEREVAARREQELRDQAAAAERRAAQAEAAALARAQEAREREEAEAARREENRRHAAAVHRKAKDALVEGGLADDAAKVAVTLIAGRKVPSVTIQY